MDSLSNIDWGSMLVRAGCAIVILIVTIILSKVVKFLARKLSKKVAVLQRQSSEGQTLGDTLGSILSLVVWLFGLIAILSVFQLNSVLDPIQGMLNSVFTYVPNIVGALFVLVLGIMIAKIVKTLIVTGLNAAKLEKRVEQLKGTVEEPIKGGEPGLGGYGATAASSQGTPAAAHAGQAAPQAGQVAPPGYAPAQPAAAGTGSKIANTIGSIVYAVIVIVVAIAAVQILDIRAVSDPAEQVLSTVLNALPNILGAGVVIALGVVIGRFVAGLLRRSLEGSSLDASLQKSGVLGEGKSVAPYVANVVFIAILLFFAVMAAYLLGFYEITGILNTVLEVGGKVALGAAVIVVGFFVGILLSKFLKGAAAAVVKWVVIVLFFAMGLQTMGLADSIIQLAFGSVVIGGAIAAVLAFGLGGREAAGRALSRLEKRSSEGPAHSAESSAADSSPEI
ncbi:MAG: mechanosensitive ion channel [Galactobacter sp.]